MTPIKTLIAGMLSMLLVGACASSSQSDAELNYRSSVATPTLELPPDLINPGDNNNLNLPGSEIGKASNVGRFKETGNINVEPAVLPTINHYQVAGSGDLFWLEVDAEVEKLYPKLKAFWADQGFRLVRDEPIAGVMQTEWLNFKPSSGSFLGNIFATFRAADRKDAYVTRLERSESGNRIYIAHMGQIRIVDPDTEKSLALKPQIQSGWQFVAAQTDKEVAMMSRLMLFLGADDERVKEEIAKIGRFPKRAEILTDEDLEVQYLKLQGGLTQSINRLRYQFDRYDVTTEELLKESQQATFRVSSSALEEDLKLEELAVDGKVSIRLKGDGQTSLTRLDVMDGQGTVSRSQQAKPLLNVLLGLLI